MLRDILRESNIIKEAKEIKKDSFTFFYIDDIKDADTITDIQDLGDRKNVELYLITDDNYKKDDPTHGEWYKVNVEDLIKYIENSVDKYEKGDYLDFLGSYKLADPIIGYLENEYKVKGFEDFDDFTNTLEGHQFTYTQKDENPQE